MRYAVYYAAIAFPRYRVDQGRGEILPFRNTSAHSELRLYKEDGGIGGIGGIGVILSRGAPNSTLL